VRSDPEPDKVVSVPNRERTILIRHPNRPKITYRFEVQGWVKRIFSKEIVLLLGAIPYFLRKLIE